MNIIVIQCLALSMLPIGIDAAISWKDLTEMRKNTPKYIAKQEKKKEKLTKKDKALIEEFTNTIRNK
jgi:hypothetical protein